jgi:hypothetical protein
MSEPLEARLAALERAVTDGDGDLTALASDADLTNRVDQAEARLEDLERQLTDLEAATQALRGYVGNVRSVNRDVEQRADAALAAVDRLAEEPADPDSPAPPTTSGQDRTDTDGVDPLGTEPTRDDPLTGGPPDGRGECSHRSPAPSSSAGTEPAAPRTGVGTPDERRAAAGQAGSGAVSHGRDRTDGGRPTGDDPEAAARPRWQDPPESEDGSTDPGLLARIRALL